MRATDPIANPFARFMLLPFQAEEIPSGIRVTDQHCAKQGVEVFARQIGFLLGVTDAEREQSARRQLELRLQASKAEEGVIWDIQTRIAEIGNNFDVHDARASGTFNVMHGLLEVVEVLQRTVGSQRIWCRQQFQHLEIRVINYHTRFFQPLDDIVSVVEALCCAIGSY